jgi:hypothetical protein
MRVARLLLFVALLAACSRGGDDEAQSCETAPIDIFKELMVVDEDVLADPRSKNALNGVWSFRHAVEQALPEGEDAGEATRQWLIEWVSRRDFNGYALDRPDELRDVAMFDRVLCPWYRRTAANACDESCSACTETRLDLAVAPFRLLAIMNRLDIRDEVSEHPSGEGRLVFGLTNGHGDEPRSTASAMTIIFEYRLPDSRSTKEWAETWHALGQHSSSGESYRAALEGVTNAFVKRGVSPKRVNGSALATIRTNESVLNWVWQLREFGLDKRDGLIHLQSVRNTPPQDLNGSEVLRDWVLANGDALLNNRYEMPEHLLAGSTDVEFSWAIPGVEPRLRDAFATGTCNGCHSTERPNHHTAFHVSPFAGGMLKLSPFMFNPASNGDDEATRRVAGMRRALCGG